jgi:hypothetical protein
MNASAPIPVALVSTSPDGDESLALGYLAASLREAGHAPHLLTFTGPLDLEPVAREVVALDAPLLGVSIPSGVAAVDVLAFLHLVRQLGYAGHVTAGGAFATLARRRLLAEYPELDSVVRHDGEVPLVQLAEVVGRGAPAATVAGITTRAGDGLPAPMDRARFRQVRAERSLGRVYAGVPQARISAVRGCWGRCRYCGLAALHTEAHDEAVRCGMSGDAIREAGIGRLRRRPTEDVADEIADLYHRRGVRYFHFVDENHLPPDSGEAEEVLAALDRELRARDVGPRAMSMMLRADAATEPVVRAMRRLGVVRSLLGVESMRAEGLAGLGRSGRADASLRAMDRLARAGVSFHFNLLLVHPGSTMASIDAEVAALHDVRGGLIDPFQVEVLEGTELFNRLQREGRLEGGPLLWHFWPQEPAARRFAGLLTQLKRRALGNIALTAFAHEVLGELAVSRQLGRLRGDDAPLVRAEARLVSAHNALWVRLLDGACALAKGPPSPGATEAFLLDAQLAAARLTLEFERLQSAVRSACTGSMRSDVTFPSAARAAAVAVAVLAAGCQRDGAPPKVADPAWRPGAAEVETRAPSGTAPSDAAAPKAAPSAAAPRPPGQGGTRGAAAAPSRGVVAEKCDERTTREQQEKLREQTEQCEYFCDGPRSAYRLVLDAEGRVSDVEMENGQPLSPRIKQCYLRSVEGQTFPCVGAEYWSNCHILLK